ncbi:MAG: hypothetical protein GXP49_08175 [Deltaproteobacteria bacterium]|nr:hypothetical protein [Deltaproteobacteria bacterium]
MKPGPQIILLVLLSFLSFGLVNEYYVFNDIAKVNDNRVKNDTFRSRKIYNELQAVDAKRKITEVKAKCFTKRLIAAIDVKDPVDRHFAVFKEAHVLAQVIVKADLFIVLDNKGIAIGRNIDAKYQGADLSKEPMVAQALQGKSGVGIWYFNGEYQLVSVVPFVREGKVDAVLVVGNALGKKTAKDNVRLLGGEFFLLHKDRILASSMSGNDTKALETFMDNHKKEILPVFEGEEGTNLPPRKIKLPAGTYWAVFSDFNQAVGGEKIAYAMLRSVTRANIPLEHAKSQLYLIGGALLFAFLGWAMLIIRNMRKPLEALFNGAQEIIHGNRDYQWDQEAPGDLGAVGGSLNAMVAILLGKELPDENETGDSWEDSLLFHDAIQEAKKDTAQEREQGAKPESHESDEKAAPQVGEENYYDKLFEDYIKARKECNESIKGISKDKFISKVKTNEKLLAERHKCKAVRFEISTDSGKAALKAFPVE